MDMNSSSVLVENGREELEEWVWVAGYSSLSTLVIIFNSVIFFSVGKNRDIKETEYYTASPKNIEIGSFLHLLRVHIINLLILTFHLYPDIF